jgi:hypothetical protein
MLANLPSHVFPFPAINNNKEVGEPEQIFCPSVCYPGLAKEAIVTIVLNSALAGGSSPILDYCPLTAF